MPAPTQPYSQEAEQAVLAALMVDNDRLLDIEGIIAIDDFFEARHRIIFESIIALSAHSKSFHPLSLTEHIKKRDEDRQKEKHRNSQVPLIEQVGGLPYLSELIDMSPSSERVVECAQTVKEYGILRKLSDAGTHIADSAMAPGTKTVQEVTDDAERMIFGIAEAVHNKHVLFHTAPQTLDAVVAQTEERAQSDGNLIGIGTGFEQFDQLTLGLQPGSFYVLAARPSVGKTAFAVNIATNIARSNNDGHPVAVFSMEMTAQELMRRVIAAEGGINHKKILSGTLQGSEKQRFIRTVDYLKHAPLYIDESGHLSPNELRSRARRLQRELRRSGKQLALIVIDYIQLMHVPHIRDNRVLEVSEITRTLKLLAKELMVPVLALSQLNRDIEKSASGEKRVPRLSDLRDSGSIEQDADVVLFIQRPLIKDKNTESASPHTKQNDSARHDRPVIHIQKNRHGETGSFPLFFAGEYMRFYNESERPSIESTYNDGYVSHTGHNDGSDDTHKPPYDDMF